MTFRNASNFFLNDLRQAEQQKLIFYLVLFLSLLLRYQRIIKKFILIPFIPLERLCMADSTLVSSVAAPLSSPLKAKQREPRNLATGSGQHSCQHALESCKYFSLEGPRKDCRSPLSGLTKTKPLSLSYRVFLKNTCNSVNLQLRNM